MALSNSTNYISNRDQIITRALRIVGELGTNETPDPTRITECALVLNDVFKEWETLGMQLWKTETKQVTLVASTGSYTNLDATGTGVPNKPLKILQAYIRNTDSDTDVPLFPLTKQEYDAEASKLIDGTVTRYYYQPPPAITAGGEMIGTLYVVNRPSANYVTDHELYYTGVFPLMDFDTSSDNPDLPSYLYNALVWALAEQLCYEAGTPLAERAMISKMADKHLGRAMSFDIEEGSLFIQPDWHSAVYDGRA